MQTSPVVIQLCLLHQKPKVSNILLVEKKPIFVNCNFREVFINFLTSSLHFYLFLQSKIVYLISNK